jgi:hypothetical protein
VLVAGEQVGARVVADRDYFSEPRDVTLEYRKKVKSLPRAFVIVTLVWVAVSLLTAVFGTLWQLFCAIVLVVIIVSFGNALAGDRRSMKRAIAQGAIVRRLRMDDEVLESIDCSAVDPGLVVARTHMVLEGLIDLHLARDWICVYARDTEFPTLVFRDEDFRDRASRQAFIAELLERIERSGKLREHEEPYNPWIGKL